MIKLTDEILNKYIDGELDVNELAEVKNELGKDDEALARLKALRAVDESLRKIEVESAPNNFTERIMQTLAAKSKAVKPKISYFFVSIVSIFSLGVIAIMIAAVRSLDKETGQSAIDPFIDKAKEFVGKNLNSFHSFFSNQNVLLVVSTLTLILLVTAYFTFESHRNFKNKLNSITH